MKEFSIENYSKYLKGDDYTAALQAAIKDADKAGGGKIIFKKGIYNFYEKDCVSLYIEPYGNGGGDKKTPIPLIGRKNITIDGGNSDFVFHGMITPCIVSDSKTITLENFTIGFDRPFHTEAEVVYVCEEEGYFDCTINQKSFPTHTENGQITAYSPYMEMTIPRFLITEYDKEKREPAYNHKYYVLDFKKPSKKEEEESCFWAETLKSGALRVHMKKVQPYLGSVIAFLNDGRLGTSIFIERSEGINLYNLAIFDAAAMAVVAQLSKDIEIEGLQVRLRREGEYLYDPERIVSVTADATHFCNCMGKLKMTNCIFDGMLDDGTNIHAIYSRFTERISEKSLAARTDGNYKGYFRVGDTVSIMKLSDYCEVIRAVITKVEERGDKWDILYEFDRIIPDFVDGDYVMDNMTTVLDDTYLSDITTGKNRPRGFLIATKGKVVVERCKFRNSSSGIFMQPFGECCLESQAVEDVTIRNCEFIDCGYADDCAAILIQPYVTEGMKPVHHNISIYGNVFKTFGPPCIEANNVENLQIYGNTFIEDNNYPPIKFNQKVILKDCNLK